MECPVCGREFPSATINTHVNECLNSNPDSPSQTQAVDADDTDELPQSQSLSNNPAKRKRVSDWGSLQPMRGYKESGPLSSVAAKANKTKRTQRRFGVKGRPGSSNMKPVVVSDELQDDTEIKCLEPCSTSEDEGKSEESPSSKNLQPEDTPSSTSLSARPSTVQHDQTSRSQFTKPGSKKELFAPLAERARPTDLDCYVGQDKAVGKDSMLYSLLSSDCVPSVILWGPPGCGKTTLARIIANNCRSHGSAKFVSLSAAVCGVNEVKDTIKIARNDQKMFHKKTVMFLDEIHRFNKAQQDILLPHVEDGTITLIGATTENPSFQVNSALLSRCRVVVLDKLSGESIFSILQRALPYIGAAEVESDDMSKVSCAGSDVKVNVDTKALTLLSNLVDGDARAALNGLQMAVQAKLPNSISMKGNNSAGQRKTGGVFQSNSAQVPVVTSEDIKEGLQRSHVLYDKTGEEHYNIISALHKSMRGSDASASLYWLARMLEGGENPLYIARRLIRFASEDIGLADPQALTQAVSAYQGCHLIGMPECEVLLAQCTVYMSRAPKSVEIYQAYKQAKNCVKNHRGPLPSVPLHLRNAPTKLMKSLGYSKGYKYNPDYEEPVEQDYFPKDLLGTDFFS